VRDDLGVVTRSRSASGSLLWWTGQALASAIRRRELSAREVVGWHLDRIAAVNPRINAVVSLRPDEALAEADAADRRAAAGAPLGPLHGLPIAIKDLEDTAGIRTTYGSTMFADHVPVVDSLLVQRLRAAGAIVVGKTNTPEFGVGSHTFNEVFGPTRNPWALDRSAGGSSGGAGAALAAGLVPIADGSDHGGSIRNPASFNNVVGLRPTPGLVPSSGSGDGWDPATVLGPMARTVGDLALILAAISGPDPRSPLSHGDPAEFCGDLAGDIAGMRVAWCPDLGELPIEPPVVAVLGQARDRLTALGCIVEDVALDLTRADEAFETLRALGFARAFGDSLPALRETAKDTVVWNIERGLALDGPTIARALAKRTEIFTMFVGILERFDVLAAPSAQVVPFPIEQEYPVQVAGVTMPHYLGWMRVCSRISLSAHPAVAVPAGFTDDGLPVGLQFVGRYHGDLRLLGQAAAWEAASGLTDHHPRLD
jgi:amidase